jgi:hypothetical protein
MQTTYQFGYLYNSASRWALLLDNSSHQCEDPPVNKAKLNLHSFLSYNLT